MKIIKAYHCIIALVIIAFSFVTSCAGYILYSLKFDRDYPAKIIYENDYFSDNKGSPIRKVNAGQKVKHRKAFCVSLDNPDKLAEQILLNARPFDKPALDTGSKAEIIYGLTEGQFVDGVSLPLPEKSFGVAPGCYDVTKEIVVPKTLPPGQYYLQLKYTYFRNGLQYSSRDGVSRLARRITFEVIE